MRTEPPEAQGDTLNPRRPFLDWNVLTSKLRGQESQELPVRSLGQRRGWRRPGATPTPWGGRAKISPATLHLPPHRLNPASHCPFSAPCPPPLILIPSGLIPPNPGLRCFLLSCTQVTGMRLQ